MSYIFLDESGDLGFDLSKGKTSKFFVITFLFCDSKKPIEKCVRFVHSILRQTHKNVRSWLHACKEKPSTRLENQASLNHGVALKVEIKTSAEEKALQAVDFISWAIFRKYEYGDDSYSNIIRTKIVEENPLFP